MIVPAGLTIADPLTLADPVLVRRENVASLHREPSPAVADGALDLRLGTSAGNVVLDLVEPAAFTHRRGRAGGEVVEATGVVLAVVQPAAALQRAAARRIPTA